MYLQTDEPLRKGEPHPSERGGGQTLLKDDIDVNELERWCRELKVNCGVLEGV